LNIDSEINIERQDYKIDTVHMWGGTCGRGRENKGYEGEGTWMMHFIYLYETEQ
jgi:hypothetical protein